VLKIKYIACAAITLMVVIVLLGGIMVYRHSITVKMFQMVSNEDTANIEIYLKRHPWLANSVLDDYWGATGLHMAIYGKNNDMVRLFLNAGADPNHPYVRDGMPLQEVCIWGNEEAVDMLLAAGADVNKYERVETGSGTPLENACRGGYLPIVRKLLAHGAQPNLVTYKGPALQAALDGYEATWTDRKEIIKLLFDHGATIPTAQSKELQGWSLLRWARFWKAPDDIIALLKQHGATEDGALEK